MIKINRATAIETALIALAALLLFFTFATRQPAPFHPDEAHKIGEAYYFHLFFVEHNFSHPDWTNDFYARINPPAAKYLMGGWLASQGHPIKDHSLQNQFGSGWDDPVALAAKVPPEILRSARRLSSIIGIMTLLVVYWIGRLSGNRLTGVLAALLLFCCPEFQYDASVALTDLMLTFFMSLMVLVTFYMLRLFSSETFSVDRKRGIILVALVIVAALDMAGAAGTKLNGALAGIFFVIALAAAALFRKGPKARIMWLTMIGSALLGVFIFVAINPYFYSAPLARISQMLAAIGDWSLIQKISPGDGLWSWSEKFSAITAFDFIGPQIYLGLGRAPLLFIVFFVGLAGLMRKSVLVRADGESSTWSRVMLLWIAVYGLGFSCWLPLDWDRLFVPLTPLISLAAAYGLVWLAKIISDAIVRRPGIRGELSWLAAAVLIAFVLWFGVVDYSLLPPSVSLWVVKNSASVEPMYERSARRHADDPLRAFYAAETKKFHDPAGAAEFYDRSLQLLDKNSDQLQAKAMRLIFQYAAAKNEIRLRHYAAAKKLLENNIAGMKAFTENFTGRDPFALGGFGLLIQEREKLLQNVRVAGDSAP